LVRGFDPHSQMSIRRRQRNLICHRSPSTGNAMLRPDPNIAGRIGCWSSGSMRASNFPRIWKRAGQARGKPR
jgi:hypothetical protein